jgi:hypothetical protein
MSIWATLLNENDELVTDWTSDAVFSFCHEALISYCHRAEWSRDDRDFYAGLLEWFTPIANRMTEPLCLLNQAAIPRWEYSEEEYERYIYDISVMMPGEPTLSYPEFIQKCQAAQLDDPYIEVKTMLKVVEDLLRVLQDIKPPDTWWYSEVDSVTGFEELFEILKIAEANGVNKVRFGYG